MKTKSEMARAVSVLEGDRLDLTNDRMEMIISDVAAVLKEYFVFTGKPEIEIKRKGGGYEVTVSLGCDSLRTFGFISGD